jgi:hypothetical protein
LQRTQQCDTPLHGAFWHSGRPRHLLIPNGIWLAGFHNDLIGDLTMDATSNTKTATLTVGNKTYDFPILSGTVGPDVIDIAKL